MLAVSALQRLVERGLVARWRVAATRAEAGTNEVQVAGNAKGAR